MSAPTIRQPIVALYLLHLLSLLFPVAVFADYVLPPRPTSLDAFVSVGVYGDNLNEAIAHETYIYLPPGRTYTVDNPIYINRPTPLFLFGAGSGDLGSKILPRNPEAPLFIVESVPHFALYGLLLDRDIPQKTVTSAQPAFRFVNTAPIRFEVQDTSILRWSVEVLGPVSTLMQQVIISDRADMHPGNATGFLIDHPEAETYLVGFGSTNHDYHVYQKHGHLEIYGLSSAFHRIADVRIDNASPKGAHVIAGGRSEGTRVAGMPSRLLTVPSTSEAVNVVVKGMDLKGGANAQAPLIDYNAAGTLWVVSTSGDTRVNALVDGTAPNATIVAFGNMINGGVEPPSLFPIAANSGSSIKIFDDCNMYNYSSALGQNDNVTTAPFRRFVNNCGVKDLGAVPSVPQISNGEIPKLDRPRINSAPPGMTSVVDLGATPSDGVLDTDAIQAALDAKGPFLYFPAGTYEIDRPLVIKDKNGGLMAGAGSENTRIVSSAESVFATDGMARVAWQGMTLETQAKRANTGSVMAIAWNTRPSGEPAGIAPTANSFYDMIFDGAQFGISMGGVNSPSSCSETMIVDSAIQNSYYGIATNSWNALNAWLNGVAFDNNEFNVATAVTETGGGSTYIFNATASRTRTQDTFWINRGHGNVYFNRYLSDAPSLLDAWHMSAAVLVLFDNSQFMPPMPNSTTYTSWRAAGGVTFLRSSLTSPGNLVQQYSPYTSAEKFALNLHSDIQGWDQITLDSYAKKRRLAPDADNDGFDADYDCDDADSSFHPGALEIAFDGYDQDCAGGDATILVHFARVNLSAGTLTVEASYNNMTKEGVPLRVEGYNPMFWNTETTPAWRLEQFGITEPPTSIRITGPEGTIEHNVIDVE